MLLQDSFSLLVLHGHSSILYKLQRKRRVLQAKNIYKIMIYNTSIHIEYNTTHSMSLHKYYANLPERQVQLCPTLFAKNGQHSRKERHKCLYRN